MYPGVLRMVIFTGNRNLRVLGMGYFLGINVNLGGLSGTSSILYSCSIGSWCHSSLYFLRSFIKNIYISCSTNLLPVKRNFKNNINIGLGVYGVGRIGVQGVSLDLPGPLSRRFNCILFIGWA